MAKANVRKLSDDEIDQVSGGNWRENKELVELYNKYNPDDQLTKYDQKIEKWVCQVWGAPTSAEWRPIILDDDGYHFNAYVLPGMGFVSHDTFIRLTAEKASNK
ncbi:MAG: hypothetical protein IKG55_01365 [Solobacterium sp.]|nr:hypothetical protein [Solobacterium sp.]